MQRSISTIIEEVCKAKKRQDKIVLLRKNDSVPLRMVLGMALDPRVQWDLPEGPAPYKPNEVLVDMDHMLYNFVPKMYNLLKAPNPIFGDKKNWDMKQFRREHIFVQMLEEMHPKDAELMVSVKDKKLPWRGITARICNEAFGTNMPVGEKDE